MKVYAFHLPPGRPQTKGKHEKIEKLQTKLLKIGACLINAFEKVRTDADYGNQVHQITTKIMNVQTNHNS